MTNAQDRPAKRMRLGTRSCVECRRRKVRCIFPENQKTCKECKAHNVVCKPQQVDFDEAAGSDATQGQDVKQRLDILERLFAQMQNTLEANGDIASVDGRRVNLAEALGFPIPPWTTARSANESDNYSESGASDLASPSDRFTSIDRAPLLSLFQEALVIEPQCTESEHIPRDRFDRVSVALSRLKHIIPDESLLEAILRATEPYWFLWPVHPGTRNSENIDACQNIRQHLKSHRAVMVAKALFWLTLAVQQLVGESRQLIADFQSTQGAAADRYFSEGNELMPADFESSDLRDGLDCLSLQCKAYINFGRPHKAWYSARTAIGTAILLGLDQPNNLDVQGRTLFETSWQYERNLGSIVALPHSISEHNPALLPSNPDAPWQQRAFHSIAITAGHLTERDRSGMVTDYTITGRIDAEIRHTCQIIPPGSWLSQLPTGLSAQQYFGQYYLELNIYSRRKALHVPFLFSRSNDLQHEASRTVALDSARSMCKTYQLMRKRAQGWLMMCDLADYQVFTGAATLALGLLYAGSDISGCDDDADWQLIDNITTHLRHTHRLTDCTVAFQAAELLENLSLARQGFLSMDEGYSVAVPYFGKFLIRPRRHCKDAQALANSQANATTLSEAAFNGPFNSIAFNPNIFPDLSFPQTINDVEFGTNWLTEFDADAELDWIQILGQPLS